MEGKQGQRHKSRGSWIKCLTLTALHASLCVGEGAAPPPREREREALTSPVNKPTAAAAAGNPITNKKERQPGKRESPQFQWQGKRAPIRGTVNSKRKRGRLRFPESDPTIRAREIRTECAKREREREDAMLQRESRTEKHTSEDRRDTR